MSDWDNRPILPKIPAPRNPSDLVECDVCHGDFPTSEINEHAGWTYCGDCESPALNLADRRLTHQLAYAA